MIRRLPQATGIPASMLVHSYEAGQAGMNTSVVGMPKRAKLVPGRQLVPCGVIVVLELWGGKWPNIGGTRAARRRLFARLVVWWASPPAALTQPMQ
jgi:hypothetical protein